MIVICVLCGIGVPVVLAVVSVTRKPAASNQLAAPEAAPANVPAPAETPSSEPAPTPSATVTQQPIPQHGSNRYVTPEFTSQAPQRSGRQVRVRVQVEDNLPLNAEQVAAEAAAVLHDNRSWASRGGVHFDFVGQQPYDFTIYVISPDTTDDHCAPLRTWGELSCQNGSRVNLNARRWAEGVDAYRDDVADYRRYLVNHEVGHFLGYDHVGCPGAGKTAPIMMQQTKGIEPCTRNPWP